mgnify:CR=1 FL=1
MEILLEVKLISILPNNVSKFSRGFSSFLFPCQFRDFFFLDERLTSKESIDPMNYYF